MSTAPSRNRLAQGYDSSLEPRVMLAADDELGNVKQPEKTPNDKKTQNEQGSQKKQAVKPRMAAKQQQQQANGNKQQANGNKQQANGNKQQANGNKQQANGNKQQANGNKQQANGNKQQANGNKQQVGSRAQGNPTNRSSRPKPDSPLQTPQTHSIFADIPSDEASVVVSGKYSTLYVPTKQTVAGERARYEKFSKQSGFDKFDGKPPKTPAEEKAAQKASDKFDQLREGFEDGLRDQQFEVGEKIFNKARTAGSPGGKNITQQELTDASLGGFASVASKLGSKVYFGETNSGVLREVKYDSKTGKVSYGNDGTQKDLMDLGFNKTRGRSLGTIPDNVGSLPSKITLNKKTQETFNQARQRSVATGKESGTFLRKDGGIDSNGLEDGEIDFVEVGEAKDSTAVSVHTHGAALWRGTKNNVQLEPDLGATFV